MLDKKGTAALKHYVLVAVRMVGSNNFMDRGMGFLIESLALADSCGFWRAQ